MQKTFPQVASNLTPGRWFKQVVFPIICWLVQGWHMVEVRHLHEPYTPPYTNSQQPGQNWLIYLADLILK